MPEESELSAYAARIGKEGERKFPLGEQHHAPHGAAKEVKCKRIRRLQAQLSKRARGIHRAEHGRIDRCHICVEHINPQHVFEGNVIGEECDATALPFQGCLQHRPGHDQPGRLGRSAAVRKTPTSCPYRATPALSRILRSKVVSRACSTIYGQRRRPPEHLRQMQLLSHIAARLGRTPNPRGHQN